MDKLVNGVAQFHRTGAPTVQPLLAHLAQHGQRPQAMMITCADSRVMPEELTQADPGDLFAIRNIGNLVPRPEDALAGIDNSVGSAVDYALTALHIENLVVMGHSGCGAMQALMNIDSHDGHIASWLRNGRLALARMDSNQLGDSELSECDRLSQINVLASVDNLGHYLSVRRKIEEGKLTLHAWWFDIPNATVHAYDKNRGKFVPLEHAYSRQAAGSLI